MQFIINEILDFIILVGLSIIIGTLAARITTLEKVVRSTLQDWDK